MGRARSLMVATIVGFVGVAGMIFYAFKAGSLWIAILSAFILLNCWGGMKQAVMLLKMAKLPRRHGYECPSCKAEPPLGNFWQCPNCQNGFDTFATGATCPYCASRFPVARCVDCGRATPMGDWSAPVVITPEHAIVN